MSEMSCKQELLSLENVEARNSFLERPAASAAATLIEVGIALCGADASAPIAGVCVHCTALGKSQASNAQHPNAFCSKECEQEFVCEAVASLSLEECNRIHQRLESLLMNANVKRMNKLRHGVGGLD